MRPLPRSSFLHAAFLIVILTIAGLLQLSAPALAQTGLLSARPIDRITRAIDDEQRVVLPGNLHPLARRRFDAGAVAADYRLERMILVLQPDAAQQAALEQFVEAQHDPESPLYHQWLTPKEYGKRFGISGNDLAQVKGWLQTHGMKVEEVAASRRTIMFSGTAGQVEQAFHTRIHTYKLGQEIHHANATDPEIPQALASVVAGVVSLHDFRSEPLHGLIRQPSPAYTAGSAHYLAPADFATIYNVNPLYLRALDGSGQSVAIVGRTNINLSDVRQFRSAFGLPAKDPQIIVNGRNPGIVSVNEQVEADLDVQWAGAVAKKAAIKFVVSASTSSSDGTYLSSQYIVNHNLAPVMSMSFGLCEQALGAAGNSFIKSLWQQAAAQGITVLVSSGDSGAAGCDSSSAKKAAKGRAVNGLCSTPYSVCVGGTQFNDTSSPGLYWAPSNISGGGSALSYIPEKAWNESGSSGLWSTGGGVSAVYAKPSWQIGVGVPNDGRRDVPDISLTAAGHDGYLIYVNGSLAVVAGTSAASPALAGLMALVVQGAAAAQGNANPAFYTLATKQRSGGAAVFHDITSGHNTVAGVTGYNAGTGYDLATGLGSVDADALVNHWSDGLIPPSFQLSASPGAIAIAAGASASASLSVSVRGGFNGPVSLSVSGLPSGVTATLTPSLLKAPGSGSSTLTLVAASSAAPGTYSAVVSASGVGVTKTASLKVNVPGFTLAVSPSRATVTSAAAASVTLTITAKGGFNSAVGLSVSGVPAGVTGRFSVQNMSAPGSGSSKLTLTKAPGTAAKTATLTVKASGGGVAHTAAVTLTVK
jgi:subtilase family serine protease